MSRPPTYLRDFDDAEPVVAVIAKFMERHARDGGARYRANLLLVEIDAAGFVVVPKARESQTCLAILDG